MNRHLYGVTFGAANGATKVQAAHEAYVKSIGLEDCGPVFLIFNGKRHRVMIACREVDSQDRFVGEDNA